MSVKRGPTRWDAHGQPTVTYTVTGTHDNFRFAHHLLHGQCEFADLGRSVMAALKRELGSRNFGALCRYMTGKAKV